MAWKHENRVCNHCGHLQTVKIKKPNHILHIILSIVTAGVWLVIYAAAAMESLGVASPKCVKCGKKMS